MNWRMLIVAVAGLSIMAADAASARARKKARTTCAPQAAEFSWNSFFFGGAPRPNGCAPAVFEYGKYVGQDPDLNIRAQLRRDPDTGYTPNRP